MCCEHYKRCVVGGKTLYKALTIKGRFCHPLPIATVLRQISDCWASMFKELSAGIRAITIAPASVDCSPRVGAECQPCQQQQNCCHSFSCCRACCNCCHHNCAVCTPVKSPVRRYDTGGFVVTALISDESMAHGCAQKFAGRIVSTLQLAHCPDIAPDNRYVDQSPQFQIVGKLGQQWNCDRALLPAGCDYHGRTWDYIVRGGRHRLVSELVRVWMEKSTNMGLNAVARHVQVNLCDTHYHRSTSYPLESGFRCDLDYGHIISGTVGNGICPSCIWHELERFCAFLCAHTASYHPVNAIFNGSRQAFGNPEAIRVDEDFATGGRHNREGAHFGKTW